MSQLLALLGLALLLLLLGLLIWYLLPRRFRGSESVASAYDQWTQDQLLERLWGEHIHLGFYGSPPQRRDFRAAKQDFVDALASWGQIDKLPAGTRLLDVGCGIGGSSRRLASRFGFDVLGVSISPGQVNRARQLTPDGMSCQFQTMDALQLDLPDGCMDVVWTVECAPHIADKQRFADELLRVLKPGGQLVAADWNQRDDRKRPFNGIERWVLEQLRVQWAHPAFSSIDSFRGNLDASAIELDELSTGDWSRETLPSWWESIWEGVRRPGTILSLGPKAVFKGLREIPTLVLMDWAFRGGLMQFGLFKASRCHR
ncbi:MAG: SAM-dependent methyltransferase [Synechococcus sp. TMED19]|nr:MAG: SAM-dependent methyltransferase [Synechococcus sp. TMED19]